MGLQKTQCWRPARALGFGAALKRAGQAAGAPGAPGYQVSWEMGQAARQGGGGTGGGPATSRPAPP